VLDRVVGVQHTSCVDGLARPPVSENPAISAELVRLGLLGAPAQARGGPNALADALLEAFGDDRWSTMEERAILARLQAAQPPRGRRGERRPRYAAMAAGGVLECVMALGFDDAADGVRPRDDRVARGCDAGQRMAQLSEALRSRGYVAGRTAAQPLLATIGRPCPPDDVSTYFSRPDGLRLAPVAGQPSTRGVVVRIVANVDGRSGAAAAAAFADGLRHAALSMYVGHWRYGFGADFEAALALEVLDRARLPADATRLAVAAKIEARMRGESFEAVLDGWLDGGLIAINRSNAARVTFGPPGSPSRSPTARLVRWVASNAGDAPSAIDGCATLTAAPRHRLWMLISCRSAAAFPAIRRRFDATALRLVGLRGLSSLRNWRKLPWVLDVLRASATWPELAGTVDECHDSGGLVVDGCNEDPCIP
jgi:hypothetical protein